MKDFTELVLPEFAFVMGYRSYDPLKGRDVILHTRTGVLMEVFLKGEYRIDENTIFYEWERTNGAAQSMAFDMGFSLSIGKATERFIIAAHGHSLRDADDVGSILESAAKWYNGYCDQMEDEIMEDGFTL